MKKGTKVSWQSYDPACRKHGIIISDPEHGCVLVAIAGRQVAFPVVYCDIKDLQIEQ